MACGAAGTGGTLCLNSLRHSRHRRDIVLEYCIIFTVMLILMYATLFEYYMCLPKSSKYHLRVNSHLKNIECKKVHSSFIRVLDMPDIEPTSAEQYYLAYCLRALSRQLSAVLALTLQCELQDLDLSDPHRFRYPAGLDLE